MAKKISISPNTLMLAHFNRNELNMFDEAQGGPNLVQVGDNQIRSYERLLPVFVDPAARAYFESIASNMKSRKKEKKPKMLERLNKLEELKNTPSPDNLGPDGQQIAKLGEPGDDDIALMPVAILDYFDAIMGKPDKNPITRLPQYKNLLKYYRHRLSPDDEARAHGFTDLKHAQEVFMASLGMYDKGSSNPLVNFRNDVLKPITKSPVGRFAAQLGTAALTGGMSLPAQLAAQAGTAGLMSRTAGNKWNNVLKDAAIAGIAHGAGHFAGTQGLGLGTQAIAKGATHYGATKALGRKGNLLESVLTGLGHFGLGGGFGGMGPLGAGVSAGSETAGTGAIGSLAAPSLGATGLSVGPSAGVGALSASQLPAAALSTTAPSLGGGSLFSTITAPIAGLAESVGLSPLQALGLGGAGLMLYKGHKDQKRSQEKARREAEEKQRAANQEIYNAMHDYAGFDVPLAENLEYPNTVPTSTGMREALVRNPVGPSPIDIMFGREHRWYIPQSEAEEYYRTHNYKKGGVVENAKIKGIPGQTQFINGPGGGQDDRVPIDYLRNGDFIWDASSTANLGDGSAKDGYAKLNQLLDTIRSKKSHVPTEIHNQPIPGALSDSEVKISAEDVDRIGNGSNKKGAAILNKMREQLRLDKIKNGKKLPHKAKNIFTYYKSAGGSL